jgi:uncharacterized protein (TIGR03067 family)
MVEPSLVEAPDTEVSRTSSFKVVAGEPMGLNMTTVNQADRSLLQTKAIYRLKGDVLTYCVGAPGQPRPTAFSTTEGDGQTLVTLKRAALQR